jgi:aryl-alcohol dehydrogenase-like predicted oxidoreductase
LIAGIQDLTRSPFPSNRVKKPSKNQLVDSKKVGWMVLAFGNHLSDTWEDRRLFLGCGLSFRLNSMKLHSLSDTDLQLSTFCCGLGDLFALPSDKSDELLDAYVEAGGNFFDTAHMYSHWLPGGNGLSEISIGDYVRRRGLKNVTIATKGGGPSLWRYRKVEHPLSPGRLSADIDDSLARLECDSITLYYLHGDDPRLAPAEIIETLNAEVNRGRIRYIAASNWPVQRIAEANEYARTKNLQPFVISQPRWSLAAHKTRAGLNSEEQISWHRKSQFPVAPYCPTAQGFFAGVPSKTDDPYDTPENHQRRARTMELAKKHGVAPSQMALAWLLNHSFPVFPILGTKNPERLKEAVAAEEIRLTAEELTWLDTGKSPGSGAP